MGKSKELFMQTNYPLNQDIEREYLFNDVLAQAWEEEEFKSLQQELNPPITKIEVTNGRQTRIETGKEKLQHNQQVEIPGHGF
jgi:hypothetical protein